MTQQPEALRLADEMERVAEYDHQVQGAAELRRLHEVAERKSDAIQKLWKQRDTLEAALRQALDALESVYGKGKKCDAAIIAAKKALTGEKNDQQN